MSFPSPEYIKMFLSSKLGGKRGDSTGLLSDAANSRPSLDEVRVHGDSENPARDSSGNESGDNGVLHNRKRDAETSRSHLELKGGGRNGYGTSDKADVSHAKERSKAAGKDEHKAKAATGGYSSKNGGQRTHKDKSDDLSGSSTVSEELFEDTMDEQQADENVAQHGCIVSSAHPSSPNSDESDADSEHCHEDSSEKELLENRKRKSALRKLIIATILSFIFMCGEIIGGYLANSLAIMTDASHLLTDVSSFLVSIIALQMAARPSSKHMTFGWHRAEVIGAITSVLAIWIVTGVLVYLAVMRIINKDYELDGKAMLITASCAIAFNVIMGIVLHEGGHGHGHGHGHSHSHDHSHGEDPSAEGNAEESGGNGTSHRHGPEGNKEEASGNVNVRAAFIHVLGDLIQSLGVLVAAFIIYFKPEYKIADPICTFLFSVLVLATTITILRDTMVIIMEGTPAGVNYEMVKEKLLSIEGVIAVHDIRIWSLTLNQSVISCHLAIDKNYKSGAILKQATKKLKSYHNFHSMTIQVETYSLDMDECTKCQPSSMK